MIFWVKTRPETFTRRGHFVVCHLNTRIGNPFSTTNKKCLLVKLLPDRPMPWDSPQHRRATIPEKIRPSRSPAPQLSGKLLLSISDRCCSSRSISLSLHPVVGNFLWKQVTHIRNLYTTVTQSKLCYPLRIPRLIKERTLVRRSLTSFYFFSSSGCCSTQ